MSFSLIKQSVILLLLSINLFSQNLDKGINAAVLSQLGGSAYSTKSDKDLSQLLKGYKDKNKIDTTSNDEDDSTLIVNDSLKLKEKDLNDYSIYQKLLRGDKVDPDSMLKNLPIFGHNLFSKSKPTNFNSSESFTVPADYPVNVGDEINIMLWGRINEEYKLPVSRDGSINIPRIGPVSVAGSTFNSMHNNLLERIKKIEGINATISMGQLRTIGVYIVGEVKSPGYYTISALSNVTNALFAAGGPTIDGSLRNIQLKRNGNLVSNIDFYDFLLSGTDRSSLRLQPGDVINVPVTKSMVAIAGNVRRSALYEIRGKTNLEDILSIAGGITPAAWANRIQIERYIKNNHKVVLDIDSVQSKLPSFEIMDGDLIKIFPVLIKDKNTVYLQGNVLRPGKYEFHEGMKITDIIPDYQTLLPETYFNYAIILRQEPPSFLNRIVTFNLKKILDNPNSTDNRVLQEKDQIVIYHSDFFEPNRSTYIDGAVTSPGKFNLFENMKIRDLILQAGGLSDDASPIRGELYRRISNNDEVVKIEKKDFCIECVMNDDPQHNIMLQRLDKVYIRSKIGWENERKITLRGQFNYPGTYILFEKETLGDLITRTGGIKDDACLSAAIFTRKSIVEQEEKGLKKYNQSIEEEALKIAIVSGDKELLDQHLALKNQNSDETKKGRVVIDLQNINNYNDFPLEDDDELFIPRNTYTVSVIGNVFNPATFVYERENANVSQLIELAGGLKNNSDSKRIYILKSNGKIITYKSMNILKTVVEPGDAIVVPPKIQQMNAHKAFVETVEAIFKTATTMATILAVLVAVKNL